MRKRTCYHPDCNFPRWSYSLLCLWHKKISLRKINNKLTSKRKEKLMAKARNAVLNRVKGL